MARLIVAAIVCACSGCGAVIDLAWLTTPGQHTDWHDEREATGQVEQSLEVRPEITDAGDLRIDCALVTRDLVREWSVGKTYDEIGFENGHALPLILEGMIVGSFTYVRLSECTDPAKNVSCQPLEWAIPFYADLLWSIYRFTAIALYEPKLIAKSYSNALVKPATKPRSTQAVACPAGARIELGDPEAQPCSLSPTATGALSPADLACAMAPFAAQPSVPTTVVVAGKTTRGQVDAADRCRFLRAHRQLLSPEQAALLATTSCL